MRNISYEIKKSIASDNWIYDYPFWNYPLEIQFLNKNDYLKFTVKSKSEKEVFFSNILDDIHNNSDTKFVDAFRIFLDYIIYNKSKSEEKEIINKYLHEYYILLFEQVVPGNYEEFLQKSISTIDVYGLGMTLYYLLNCSISFFEKDIISDLETCFFNMTNPNLLERFSIEQAIDEFETIMINSGFMSEFGLDFENHEIVQKTMGVTKYSGRDKKKGFRATIRNHLK
jgi:hypothetical protein